ncbi:hypothetical protein KR044_011755 [Drosophila immigrans]|nr:hypothetical protein KR044_011755 [Drosophila immigrans]
MVNINLINYIFIKSSQVKLLNLDERLSNIQSQFEGGLNLFYMSAQKELDNQQVAYLPLTHSKDIDFKQINALQQMLPNSHIFIAITDNTGNILYYQITEGFSDKSIFS